MTTTTTTLTPRRTSRRLGRLSALLAVLVTAVTLALGAASPASAATLPSVTLSANCQYAKVSAEGPDLHWWGPGWAVAYRFQVFEYTSAGWVKRQTYPSTGYLSARSGVGMGNDVYGFSARSGYAYNVSIEMYWYYNNVYQGYQYQSEIHTTLGYVSSSTTWCRVL